MDLDKKLLDYAKGRQVIITIELSTIEPQGMLLWQGKNDKDISNYIALGIDNKHVSLKFYYSKLFYQLRLSGLKEGSVSLFWNISLL